MPALGSRIALPNMNMLDGTQFSPANAKGRVNVLYWWASTCPFCALQSPEMQTLWLTHQNQGLQLLAMSVDKSPADAVAEGALRRKRLDQVLERKVGMVVGV